MLTPGNAKYAPYFRATIIDNGKDHRAHPVGVIQVKIDPSNKNNARSALSQLRSERETGDGVGMYLKIG